MPSMLVALLSLAVPKVAQQPSGPLIAAPAVARMVIVDAFVVDRKGRPVTDLRIEDFALLEDDKKVAISAFVPPVTAPASGTTAGRTAAQLPDAEPPTLVLYVDRKLLGPSGRRRALDQAYEIAVAHMAQGARAVVIAEDNDLRPLTPLTKDPAAIRAALTRIQGWATTSPSVSDARSTLENVKTVIEMNILASCDCVCSMHQSLQVVRGYAVVRDIEAREASARLTFLVNALLGVSGRKSLIYVSEGLEDRPGLQLYDQLRTICPEAMMKEGSTVFAAMQEFEATPILREATARANAARVTIYPIDARGLSGLSVGDISQRDRAYVPSPSNDMLRDANLKAPLQRLGDDTGGFALLNGVDPKTAMKRFDAAEQGHYVLGFVPAEPDGKVHRLWLRLDGAAQDKRNVDIRHRESYLRAELTARRGQRALSALLFGLEESALEASIELERTSNTNARVHVSLSLSNLAPLAGTSAKEARVQLVISFRPVGRGAQAVTVREKDVTLGLDTEEMSRDGGRRDLTIDVPVAEGPYEFAIGIEDLSSGAATYVRRSLGLAGSK